MNPIFANLETSVFEVMSRLARETGAVNLGQGFPDDPGPEDVRRKAAEAVVEGWNQYPPMMGLPELRQRRRRALPALARPRARSRTPRSWSPPAPPRRSPARSWR